jgi:exosortase/archaeosortase family protein
MDTLLKSPLPQLSVYQCLIGLGMLLMAIEPIAWLVNSWLAPSHDSQGGWVFLLCAGLFVWSVCSPRYAISHNTHKRAIILLLSTALIRGIGQMFAVNVLGAVALAVDVYALALLLDLNHRKNALSAGWLAVLFTFSLPIERILQRLIGFGLQHLSANGACWVLQGLFEQVQCLGIRLLLAGRDVLVDLPCSGMRSITLLCLLYATLMCVFRPSLLHGLLIGVVTLASALLANVIRISVLATFIAYPEKIGGINVMTQPYHDLIGLVCLTLASLPLIGYAMRTVTPASYKVRDAYPTKPRIFPSALSLSKGEWKNPTHQVNQFMLQQAQHERLNLILERSNEKLLALGFVILAVVIISLPRQPLDISDNKTALNLPVYLNGEYAQTVKLSQQEQNYFTQYGGAALKRRYGDSSVLLIRSNSPLRHIHTPDDCLRGLGFEVQYQAVHYQPLPTVTYLATAKDGSQWRVAVSFYSEQQQFTTNVSEVVWRWLQQPHSTWYALQRITPLYLPDSKAAEWDNALVAALDLNYQESSHVKPH